jgi:hypothetical protein
MGIGGCYSESELSIVCSSSSSTAITSIAACASTSTQCGTTGTPCTLDTECCSQACATSDGSGGLLCD